VSGSLPTLAHDHRELTALFLAVRESVARVERGPSTLDDELHEIRDGVESLREALLDHFAREQEGLFPFVRDRAPELSSRTDALTHEHDLIATRLTDLVSHVDAIATMPTEGVASFRTSLSEFEALYASHSRAELAFLRDVEALLAHDPQTADALQALLEEP
jgi:iron-sulfur cluster repair protein YtfE (RIC family)